MLGLGQNPGGPNTPYARAAYLSFGQLLRSAACALLDVGTGELAEHAGDGRRPRLAGGPATADGAAAAAAGGAGAGAGGGASGMGGMVTDAAAAVSPGTRGGRPGRA